MFTGLIEEVGTIQSVRHGARSCVLTIGCRTVLEGSQIGDSIAGRDDEPQFSGTVKHRGEG